MGTYGGTGRVSVEGQAVGARGEEMGPGDWSSLVPWGSPFVFWAADISSQLVAVTSRSSTTSGKWPIGCATAASAPPLYPVARGARGKRGGCRGRHSIEGDGGIHSGADVRLDKSAPLWDPPVSFIPLLAALGTFGRPNSVGVTPESLAKSTCVVPIFSQFTWEPLAGKALLALRHMRTRHYGVTWDSSFGAVVCCPE